GLLTSEGDFWLRQRRLVQPAFHRGRIASYADTMVRFTERLLEEWKDGEAQDNRHGSPVARDNRHGGPVTRDNRHETPVTRDNRHETPVTRDNRHGSPVTRDIHAEMMRLTLQIVAKTLFDADVDREARQVGHALEAIMELNSDFRKLVMTPPWLPTPRNIRAALATRKLNKIIYRIIEQRRASRRDTGDLLSMLLNAQDEDGSRMNDRQLRDEAITLFLAGHET